MSVLLKGQNGNELELAFVAETLPDVQDGLGDASYFTVVWRAATADGSWEGSAPCLNGFEFQNLAEWLGSVGGGAEGEVDGIDLLEPELRFTVTGRQRQGVTIRVGFHLADRPEEFGVDAPTERSRIDLFMDRASVLAAAAALRGALEDFGAVNSGEGRSSDGESGAMGRPDDNLNLIDRIERYPPGAGRGADNAGNS
ncbi:MAG: hypothetical protein IT437_06945 [Phycisphaerales bacterium]|nr:hypothetical protein [Phycisphaerales bacterium]